MKHHLTMGTGLLAAAVLAISLTGSHADDDGVKSTGSKSPPDKATRSAIQEALSPFNSLIGGWRGVGQVRRGSTRGAWQETGTFIWKFSGGNVGIEYQVKDPKHVKTGLISWDPAKKHFTMNAVLADDSKQKFTGQFQKKVLTLMSESDSNGYVWRVSFRPLNEKRMLVTYERRKATASFYARVGEVGYTREGTRLAASDNTGPECVVTGGAGTIKVSHKGKTYYVCCSGCRDAFNDDPEAILEDYFAKLDKK